MQTTKNLQFKIYIFFCTSDASIAVQAKFLRWGVWGANDKKTREESFILSVFPDLSKLCWAPFWGLYSQRLCGVHPPNYALGL